MLFPHYRSREIKTLSARKKFCARNVVFQKLGKKGMFQALFENLGLEMIRSYSEVSAMWLTVPS
jgi:hypothetical protein